MGQEQASEFAARLRAWQESVHDELEPVHTDSGLPVAPVYYPDDAGTHESYLRQQGFPGQFPYTRGVRPLMHRDGLWVMGMYSGRASPEETNRRIRSLIDAGQKGFSVALDLPTQNGLDSDHPLAAGEVGKVGVPIDTLRDMEDLLEGIPLDRVEQIRTTANAIGPIAAAMFIVAAERHGHPPDSFRLMLQNDPLKEFVARGTFVLPPAPAVEFAVDVIEYCAEHLPHWEPIEFCGYHVRDSGADAVQEVAIAMANGLAYLEAARRRGVDVAELGPRLYLFLAADLDLFEEVAKFRAARRLWARLMRDRLGAPEDQSGINLFVYTLGSPLTAQEPLNNTVRVTLQALAAVLGGAQTLATSSYDEALGLPSDAAARLALRTQQIIGHETGVANTADPLGGSWFVEALTDELEARIGDYLQEIDDHGGAIGALQNGWLAAQLEESAYRRQRDIEDGTRTVVGVNRFAEDRDPSPTGWTAPDADEDVEARQVERLREVRGRRDDSRVDGALAGLREAARGGRNTIPPLLEAVRAYCSVGEICSTLEEVWGRHGGDGS